MGDVVVDGELACEVVVDEPGEPARERASRPSQPAFEETGPSKRRAGERRTRSGP